MFGDGDFDFRRAFRAVSRERDARRVQVNARVGVAAPEMYEDAGPGFALLFVRPVHSDYDSTLTGISASETRRRRGESEVRHLRTLRRRA